MIISHASQAYVHNSVKCALNTLRTLQTNLSTVVKWYAHAFDTLEVASCYRMLTDTLFGPVCERVISELMKDADETLAAN